MPFFIFSVKLYSMILPYMNLYSMIPFFPGPEAIIVPVFFAVCFVVGCIGNCLVIVVMTKIRQSQSHGLSNTNKLILNLAIADLLFLFFCVPFHSTVYSLLGWPFGSFMCFFTKFAEELTKSASVYSLVALSIDR